MHRCSSYHTIIHDSNSEETIRQSLLPRRHSHHPQHTRTMSSSRDAAQLTGVATERCVSNGVGGAGNLRKHSFSLRLQVSRTDVIIGRPSVSKAMVAAINDDESPPRRSSVWSVNSNDGKPASIITVAKQMFRKGSSASVEEEPRT